MKRDVLNQVLAFIEAKRPVVLAVNLESGEQRLLRPKEGIDERERAQVEEALRLDKPVTTEPEAGPRCFYQPFNPPLRLVLVGAVHIAQPLSVIATLAGYEVTIVDPRSAFAATERFPGVTLNLSWPDAAMESLGLDARSAVVTLTHDPKLDDPALSVALESDAFFIGCLGSKKTHATRLKRLRKAGFSDAQLERLRGPVGLPIGSRSPAEIAVSVLAQVIETLRRPQPTQS
ncbi:MAG: XdhC family protein [Deltaproteobacteria bacterium]|nr:XdhC family protein [Deltaproteobacteria bacterium]